MRNDKTFDFLFVLIFSNIATENELDDDFHDMIIKTKKNSNNIPQILLDKEKDKENEKETNGSDQNNMNNNMVDVNNPEKRDDMKNIDVNIMHDMNNHNSINNNDGDDKLEKFKSPAWNTDIDLTNLHLPLSSLSVNYDNDVMNQDLKNYDNDVAVNIGNFDYHCTSANKENNKNKNDFENSNLNNIFDMSMDENGDQNELSKHTST